MRGRMRAIAAGAVTVAALTAGTTAALALDPQVEAENFSKGNERSAIYNTPEYQAKLRQIGIENRANSLAIQAADPERNFLAQLCASGEDGCAGDIRLYDWQAKGYGIVQPVLFTARNGATLSGRIWSTKAGPAKRPGVVITNGSVQADEQLYWFAAQTLAKAGYVVMTFDPQGQGQSDTPGEAPDDGEGVPAQSDGRPFYDGTQDAIDFFFSTPDKPYVPRKSCEIGHEPAAQAGPPREGEAERRLQPVPRAARPGPRGRGRPLVRRGGRLLRRPGGPAREGDRRLRQPRRQRPGADPAVPRRPVAARDPADHEAGPRHLRRLRAAADAEPLGPRPDREEHLVAQVLGGGRRHGRDHDPRRHAPGLRLDPERGLPGHAARRGPDHLVHDRVVRQVREGRRHRRPAAADRPLAQRRAVGRGRPERRPQHVLVLLPLAARHRPAGPAGGGRFVCEDLRPGCPACPPTTGSPRSTTT